MKSASRLVSCLFVVILIAGCASSKVTDSQRLVTERIPRPDHILVYDFAATHDDVPADSALASHSSVRRTPQAAEHIATGRRVGAKIAKELVAEIRKMGMPAEWASNRSTPQINDIVIRGYLLSVDEGSAMKRMTIGFGSGTSHLSVAVEGYQMTARGLRKLGSGKVESGGGKAPGGAVPLAVALATGNPLGLIVSTGLKVYGEKTGSAKIEGRAKQTAKKIADLLRTRFKEEGWIK
ncbi:MAG: DUF4410 domain-containing protein [Proteobacteria bacterium]|nr:DUF4410 domain-containing protein [Pseudomonadota bacterium]